MSVTRVCTYHLVYIWANDLGVDKHEVSHISDKGVYISYSIFLGPTTLRSTSICFSAGRLMRICSAPSLRFIVALASEYATCS